MAKSSSKPAGPSRRSPAFEAAGGAGSGIGPESLSSTPVSAVRLLRQTGFASDPVVTLIYMIRRELSELSFSKYESSIKGFFPASGSDAVEWSGSDAYERLLEATRSFTGIRGTLRFSDEETSDRTGSTITDPASDTFTPEDAATASTPFYPDSVSASDMEANGSLIANDADPDGEEGELSVTKVRRQGQTGSNEEILPNSDPDDPWNSFDGVLRERLENFCCIELIWSYWMEQAMLVQGMNAITMRYQNRRPLGPDPLARCDISHLRPLNNLMWGYIQKEPDRLSLPRRAYEYDHHYGLRLTGSAVPTLQPADSRSRFLGAFHRVLNLASRYYAVSMNTTMMADAYPALHAIKELALLLEEGMHNQYGDLPRAAREEMLIQQYFLNRPEFRQFLGGRPNVTYQEPWMPQLDTMRTLMGWNDASIRHYYDLATYGEIILVSVRAYTWSLENRDTTAAAWLQALRAEVQGYIHAYRSVTGVDLSNTEVNISSSGLAIAQPTDLILRRRSMSAANGRH